MAGRYHPSGAIASFTYGNGFAYTATLNARQQTLQIRVRRDGVEVTNFTYA